MHTTKTEIDKDAEIALLNADLQMERQRVASLHEEIERRGDVIRQKARQIAELEARAA